MKTVKNLNFGFSAVNAGQRSVSVEPHVIATSIEGGFRMTAPVSRALGIANGEYVMFLSNVANIDAAIAQKDQQIVDFCKANELELGSAEAAIAIHKEFDAFAIAKGIKEFDAKGNVRSIAERLSKSDKLKFVAQKFDEMFEAALAQADDATKDALSRDGVTKEEQMEILTAFVTPRELPKFKGSKVYNPAGLTGIGTSLNFTDSNVWKQLKVDLSDDAGKFNRIYDVDVDNLQDVIINDGYKDITIKAVILGDYVDKEPSRIGRSAE